MKIIITGHTSGIGKGFYEYFSKDNNVIGVSRSTGYDITDESSRNKILELCRDADMFINNACVNGDFSQVTLLKMIYESWKLHDRIIINISSLKASYYDENDKFKSYFKIKKELNDFCAKNQHESRYPYIINLKPGLVDTNRVISETGKKMKVQDIITIVDFILKNKDNFRIHDIGFKQC
jgi:short-subunit dehydrogenase involved in D-alanine esterification of teichoic acids